MPDHLHIVIGMRPTQSLSDLMQDIKGNSSKWINDNKLVAGKFAWQEGYGAFSYNKSPYPSCQANFPATSLLSFIHFDELPLDRKSVV